MSMVIIRADGTFSAFEKNDDWRVIANKINARYIEMLPLVEGLQGWEAYVDEEGRGKHKRNRFVGSLMDPGIVKYYNSAGGIFGDVAILIPTKIVAGCPFCVKNKNPPCKVPNCGTKVLCVICSKNNTVKHKSNCKYY